MLLRKFMQYPVLGYSIARFIHFRSQHTVMRLMVSRLPWVDKKLLAAAKNGPLTQILFKELTELFKQDSQNIADGIYPLAVLKPEGPTKHFSRLPRILWDGLKIYNRKVNRVHRSFSKKAEKYFSEVPEYLRRNYHFQTDGYLSEESAELYEHQVELLFSGAADAMRRVLLRPLKESLGTKENQRFLEVACGTGRMTRFMALTFPQAKIIATDVSRPYLKVARNKLKEFSSIDFLQADAQHLSFKDGSFDLVFCVFMFHELPPDIRVATIQEAHRVLKPGGIFAFVDSVQIVDFEDAKSALQQFPLDYHEPFFKSYIENPMEDILTANGFQFVTSRRGFLAKAVTAQKWS